MILHSGILPSAVRFPSENVTNAYFSPFFSHTEPAGVYPDGQVLVTVVAFLHLFPSYNVYPAKIFMGDTGSLYLGGMVVAMAYLLDNPLILFPIGIIYIMESFSVILQVGYFKLTHGKRLFKMSPIHHHFEKCGWSEGKIVAVFSLVSLGFCLLAYFGM